MKKVERVKTERPLELPVILALANKILSVIGFTDVIDRMVKWDEEQCRVTPGNLCKAMVLSTFLDVRSPLYKVKEKYEGIDTETLFGEGIKPEDLNAYSLGRALDKLNELDAETVYRMIAVSAVTIYQVAFHRIHADTTTISFYGEYDTEEDECTEDILTIERGYNKDGRPECKQIVMGKMTTEHGVPLAYKAMDGSTADVVWNEDALQLASAVFEHLRQQGVFIADSKLMCRQHLKTMMDPKGPIPFISRCPANFSDKLEERVVQKAYEKNAFEKIGTLGSGKKAAVYEACEFEEEAYGLPVRLIVVKSSAGSERYLEKKKKQYDSLYEDLEAASLKEFVCLADAEKELERFKKAHKGCLYDIDCDFIEEEIPIRKKGRPSKDGAFETEIRWHLGIWIKGENPERASKVRRAEESFVLVSNVRGLSKDELLREYKNQQVVEIDFRLMKGPNMVSAVFLKKPGRIEALMMLINISLLVRALVQYKMRKGLSACQEEPPRIGRNYGKLQGNPTFAFLQDCLAGLRFIQRGNEEYSLHLADDREANRADILLGFVGYTIEELLE
jgi:transposase